MIINLPKNLEKETTHRYSANSFKLHRLPVPRPGQVRPFQIVLTGCAYRFATCVSSYPRCKLFCLLPSPVLFEQCRRRLLYLQVLGLVGTNGIGKSTALKVLSGKLKPNLGRFDVSIKTCVWLLLYLYISAAKHLVSLLEAVGTAKEVVRQACLLP